MGDKCIKYLYIFFKNQKNKKRKHYWTQSSYLVVDFSSNHTLCFMCGYYQCVGIFLFFLYQMAQRKVDISDAKFSRDRKSLLGLGLRRSSWAGSAFGFCDITKFSPLDSHTGTQSLPRNLLQRPVLIFISQSAAVSGWILLKAKTCWSVQQQ